MTWARRTSAGLLLVLSGLGLGCGTGNFGEAPAAAAVAVNGTRFTGKTYHAYGDSITLGYGLADPAQQNFAAVIAQNHGFALADYALGTRGACDVATQEIFPVADSPTLNNGTLYSLLISTNDINFRGAGAYESIFNLCHQAAIAWLAVPEEQKVRAFDPSVTTLGATHTDRANNWNTVTLDAAGASVSFPVTLDKAGPVYAWYRVGDGNPGSFRYALDGNVLGQLTTATSPAIATAVGNDNSIALLRLPAVSPGRHVVTFTQISSGVYAAGFLAVAAPAEVMGLPRVVVGTTPRMKRGSDWICAVNDAVCQAYIADISANVALFVGDHLNVQLFDSRKYMTGTAADMETDGLHPNVLGEQEIAHALEDVL